MTRLRPGQAVAIAAPNARYVGHVRDIGTAADIDISDIPPPSHLIARRILEQPDIDYVAEIACSDQAGRNWLMTMLSLKYGEGRRNLRGDVLAIERLPELDEE